MAGKAWSRMASIFVGSGGLRAGWRFLLFALGIELAEFYLRTPLLYLLSRRSALNLDELSAPALFIGELVGFISVLLVTGIAASLERRRVDDYGLPVSQAFGRFFWKGALAGLLVVGFVAGGMIVTGAMKVHGLALQEPVCPGSASLVRRECARGFERGIPLSRLCAPGPLAGSWILAGGLDHDCVLRRAAPLQAP